MKTTAYLQIAPKFSTSGKLLGVTAKRVSTNHPKEPMSGAVTLKLNIEIPDEAFKPVDVDIDVPMEALEPTAKVKIAGA